MLVPCCLQPLDLIQYDSWNVILPEGEFLTKVGRASCFASYLHPLLPVCRSFLSAVSWVSFKQLLPVLISRNNCYLQGQLAVGYDCWQAHRHVQLASLCIPDECSLAPCRAQELVGSSAWPLASSHTPAACKPVCD